MGPFHTRRRKPVNPADAEARDARGKPRWGELRIRGQIVAIKQAVIRAPTVIESAHIAVCIHDLANLGRVILPAAGSVGDVRTGINLLQGLAYRVERAGWKGRGDSIEIVVWNGEWRRGIEQHQRVEQKCCVRATRVQEVGKISSPLGQRRQVGAAEKGVVVTQALEIEKIESPVMPVVNTRDGKRSANASAVLVAVEGRDFGLEEVPRVELVIPQVFVERPMELIGARLSDHVDLRATRDAELGVIDAGFHLEFLNGVERRSGRVRADRNRGVAHAVEEESIHGLAHAVDFNRAASIVIQFRALNPRHHARRKQHGLKEAPAVIGKFADLRLLDGGAHGRGLSVEDRRTTLDVHHRRHLPGLQLQIHFHVGVHAQLDNALGCLLKALLFRADAIVAGRQQRKLVGAVRPARGGPSQASLHFCGCEGHLGDDRAQCVGHDSGKAARRLLRPNRSHRGGQQNQYPASANAPPHNH